MKSKQRIGLAIGGGLIAAAAAVGVGAAAANLAAGSQPTVVHQAGAQQNGNGSENSGRSGQRMDTSALAQALATKLGVDQTKVQTALDNALKANRPADSGGGAPGGGAPGGSGSGGGGSMPSGSGSQQPGGAGDGGPGSTTMLTKIAASMATELNLDQTTVLTALQSVWATSGPGAGQQPSGQATS